MCNLASIAVNRFLCDDGVTYDHERLHAVARLVTRNLNRIIDINSYPTPETRASNEATRPIGIGMQGLGDLYCMLKLPYADARAIALDAEIMETIYHGALEESVALAERDGAYPRFAGSPMSSGVLQFDMWGKRPGEAAPALSGRYDWDALRARLMVSGARNSLLTALMPTASTSQILGNCECFEPFQSNVFKRSTLAGEFMVVNRHLMRDLMALGLWNDDMRRMLLANDGSVQVRPPPPPPLPHHTAVVRRRVVYARCPKFKMGLAVYMRRPFTCPPPFHPHAGDRRGPRRAQEGVPHGVGGAPEEHHRPRRRARPLRVPVPEHEPLHGQPVVPEAEQRADLRLDARHQDRAVLPALHRRRGGDQVRHRSVGTRGR